MSNIYSKDLLKVYLYNKTRKPFRFMLF